MTFKKPSAGKTARAPSIIETEDAESKKKITKISGGFKTTGLTTGKTAVPPSLLKTAPTTSKTDVGGPSAVTPSLLKRIKIEPGLGFTKNKFGKHSLRISRKLRPKARILTGFQPNSRCDLMKSFAIV